MKILALSIGLILLTACLPGCGQRNIVRDTKIDEPTERYCTYVNDINGVLSLMNESTSTKTDVTAKIPNSPIEVDFSNKADREFVTVFSELGERNAALMTISKLAFLGVQTAPCHDGNRKDFWRTVNRLIDVTGAAVKNVPTKTF